MTLPPAASMDELCSRILGCNRCPKLRKYCLGVAREKRRQFMDWDYHGLPVHGFGDPDAWLWIVGLAPAAHGANRTGRVFTGDYSGDFLYARIHDMGWSNQAESRSRSDGLKLSGVWVSAAVRCAPPDNKPTPLEQQRCRGFLSQEFNLLKRRRVVLALGAIAWDNLTRHFIAEGLLPTKPRVPFSHGVVRPLGGGEPTLYLMGCYHVSPRNTFTGVLTPGMFLDVLARARELAG